MNLTIPELALVVLIGPSGSGKSTFARKHFKPTEVLSSDYCRGLVSDDENCQAATKDAFDVLHFIARKRLAAARLTVVDATNVQPEARKSLVELAREHHCLPVAIVFDLPERICHDRNAARQDRSFGPHVIRQQMQQMRRSLRGLEGEGFRRVHRLQSEAAVEAASIVRQPLWNNRRNDHGPFDIIGDVHGCYDELAALLAKLGYAIETTPEPNGTGEGVTVRTPPGRTLVFLGDLVDRGPNTPGVLRLAMSMVQAGAAICVPGNHDIKLMRKLQGRDVRVTHGLAESLEQIAKEPPEFAKRVGEFIDGMVSHYVFDDGKLVVAHAGMKECLQGRGSGAVRDFALYGETTGETDEFGLPVRHNWAADYRGNARVVYGHTPIPEPEWLNRTINIDTGCVFGGKLTALRYPENELVSVQAASAYCQPAKPFLPVEPPPVPALTAQQQNDDLLDMEDVLGKRIVSTRLQSAITIREENAIAALEVMSRFAVNPKWLIYLPPTMSPTQTSVEPGLLEHPAEAFSYFRHEGIPRVVCEQKHMGSRAVVLVCRDEASAKRRFGVANEGAGIIYTRTGRRFLEDSNLEAGLLARVRAAMDRTEFWDELATDWACLDAELMPWSLKAQALLKEQYAAVGAAAQAALADTETALQLGVARGVDVDALRASIAGRREMTRLYAQAYRQYCWPVQSVDDLKLAPFHLLATEGHVHTDKDHLWHMATLSKLCGQVDGGSAVLMATPHRTVDVTDDKSQAEAVLWWETLTATGGEGMVVKPVDFIARGPRGLIQPAVKCRGKEYLRIIYGPEYNAAPNLDRLRSRGLGFKRSLALREFALGIEALERFVRREPLRRVHECVFGVLALESEPVDPRL